MYNYEFLERADAQFDKKEFARDFYKIRKSKRDLIVTNAKARVFLSLRVITVKNIENFFSICKKYNYTDLIHTRNDLVTEFYIIFDKCLKGFNIKEKTNFYWYLFLVLFWLFQLKSAH